MNTRIRALLIGMACAAFVTGPALGQTLSPDALPPFPAGDAAESASSLQAPMSCLIEPYQVSELGSPSPGIIDKVLVQRGDTIKEGQVLAELDKSVDKATLALHKAEAAHLGRVVSRNASLYERKLLPAKDYDEITSKHRQAQLQVQLQEAILAERDIRSPFDGVVAERYAGPGDRVNDNKILKVAQIDPLLVKVVVPEDLFGQINIGDQAQVTVNRAVSQTPLTAAVWRIDMVMDAASGTYTVLLKLDNPGQRIPAGLRCSIRF